MLSAIYLGISGGRRKEKTVFLIAVSISILSLVFLSLFPLLFDSPATSKIFVGSSKSFHFFLFTLHLSPCVVQSFLPFKYPPLRAKDCVHLTTYRLLSQDTHIRASYPTVILLEIKEE